MLLHSAQNRKDAMVGKLESFLVIDEVAVRARPGDKTENKKEEEKEKGKKKEKKEEKGF